MTRASEGRTPAWWALAATGLATHVLPAGAARDRYRQEFLSELSDLRRARQAAFTYGVLSRAWALRTAVTTTVRPSSGDVVTTQTPRRPLLCVLDLQHAWLTRSTEDGGRYRACRKCGKESNPFGTLPPGAGTLG
jgi:hypothetical protein